MTSASSTPTSDTLWGWIHDSLAPEALIAVSGKPSIAVWIDPETQTFKCDFNPQELSPAQYGVVLASIILHVSKLFNEHNPHISPTDITSQILAGIRAGLEQIKDVEIPAKAH